jgi:integrase
MNNPCQDSVMVKAFKSPRMKQKDIISKESVDEIIYRSKKIRDRLILELQARCGMIIGEVLNLRVSDITDRKLTIRQPMPAVTAFLWKWYQRYFSGTRILKPRRCTWGKSQIQKQ